MTRFFLYLALIFVPLIYLPWTSDVLEINKQIILVFSTIFALLFWLGSFVIQRSFTYKKTGIYILLLSLLVGVVVSSGLSRSIWLSVFGGMGQEYTSLVTWVAVIVLFIIGINIWSKVEDAYRVMHFSFLVIAFILFFGALSVFGIYIFNENFIGAPNAMGVIAVMGLIMALGFNILKKDLKADELSVLSKVSNFSTIAIIPFSLIILHGLDYWFLWLATALGVVIILSVVLASKMNHITLSKMLLMVLVLVLSIIFFLVPTPGKIAFPAEVTVTYPTSWQIAKDTVLDTSLLFGSGPGTFEIDYHQYKTAKINESDYFWNLSFNRSGSHILTMLATMGIFSTFVYLLFLLWMKLKITSWMLKTEKDSEWFPVFILTLGWMILLVSQFFYSSNLTLLTLFWIYSSVIIGTIVVETKNISYKKTPRVSFILSFGFIICSITIVTAGFITISRYVADIAFAQAIAHSESGEGSDKVIEDLVRATEMNKWSDIYARNLAHALLIKSGELLSDPEVNPESVQAYIANSIDYAKLAVKLSPYTVANQSMLGDVYRELLPFVSGSDVFAIEAYQRAIELSPTNPIYYVALGRAYIAQADLLDITINSDDVDLSKQASLAKHEALILAVETFKNALVLKSNHSVAQYYLSLAYERSGNLSDAIVGLEVLKISSPYDVGLAFQLGVLYLQQGKLSESQLAFEYVIDLSPIYSNARWFLSSVFEQQGELELAIEQIELVLIENPDNDLIIQRLERLKAGLVVEEDLEPLEEDEETVE